MQDDCIIAVALYNIYKILQLYSHAWTLCQPKTLADVCLSQTAGGSSIKEN